MARLQLSLFTQSLIYPILGFIVPGWGHAAQDRLKQAAIIQATFYLALFLVALSRLIVTVSGLYLFIFLIAGFHLYSAISSARKTNSIETPRYKKLVALLIFPLPCLLILLTMFIAKPYILGVQFYQVKSNSMKPTLYDGDIVLVDTWRYHFSTPAEGDIILFTDKNKMNFTYIKRIVNNPDGQPNNRDHGFYVKGDNLSHSIDSRHLGVIASESIKGRAEIVFSSKEWELSKL